MVNQERASAFLAVSCKCGRGLRAKAEQAGGEIRCWDCHQMVPVPIPNQGHLMARELSDGAMVVIQGPGMNSVLGGAAIVTACLAIPIYGTWCSIIALTLGASAYGETIRRVSRGSNNAPDANWWTTLLPRSITKLILCLLLAAGTVVPLWILSAGPHRSPHWNRTGLAIGAATWLILPMLFLGVYGQKDEETRLGIRGASKVLAGHPFATLLALAAIPWTLVLLEIALGLIFYIPGSLPFFALDFMPMPQKPYKPVMYEGIPHYNLVDFRSYGETMWIDGYFDGLSHGYSFVNAIPASLANTTQADLDPYLIGMPYTAYFMLRVLIAMIIVTCLMAAFAIQARWLGSIPTLGRRRLGSTAPRPPASLDPAPPT